MNSVPTATLAKIVYRNQWPGAFDGTRPMFRSSDFIPGVNSIVDYLPIGELVVVTDERVIHECYGEVLVKVLTRFGVGWAWLEDCDHNL